MYGLCLKCYSCCCTVPQSDAAVPAGHVRSLQHDSWCIFGHFFPFFFKCCLGFNVRQNKSLEVKPSLKKIKNKRTTSGKKEAEKYLLLQATRHEGLKSFFTSVVGELCLPLDRSWSMVTNERQVLLRKARRTADGIRLLAAASAGMCQLWLISFVACWLFITSISCIQLWRCVYYKQECSRRGSNEFYCHVSWVL